MNGTRKCAGFPYLPPTEDLLRLIDEWGRRTGVPRAQLAKVLDLDRSAVTRIFSGKRELSYDEAAQLVDYLVQRLSPLPDRTVGSIAPRSKNLRRVYANQKVGAAVKALMDGNFTQVPVYEGNKFLGLVTDRMIIERLLHPNLKDFTGTWMETLRNMTVREAEVIETSSVYPFDSPLSSVASALGHFYAVMLGEDMKGPTSIVTRWDYLKLLKE